jgi:hypothetical protein
MSARVTGGGQEVDLPQCVRQLISVGHRDMPEFRFKPDDARALRDYLRTIQR